MRRLKDMGWIIDTLVSAGANQVDGPSFSLDEPDDALDEARAEAMRRARQRADLYARSADMRVGRIVSISEQGGYYPVTDIAVTGMRGGAAKRADAGRKSLGAIRARATGANGIAPVEVTDEPAATANISTAGPMQNRDSRECLRRR